MSKRDEFIYRDRQKPADLRQIAPDVGSQADRDAMARAPAGEPLADYTVRSVYDSRPINGYDFNIVASDAAAAAEVVLAHDLFFAVPDGYVAVLREISIWMETDADHKNTVNYARSDVQVEAFLNGATVNYVKTFTGEATDLPIKVFVIADENQLLGARVTLLANPSVDIHVYANLYGNFLLKTGRTAQFEVGNFAGGVSIQGRRG